MMMMMMMVVVCFCEDPLLKPIFTDNLNKLVVVLLYLSVYIYISDIKLTYRLVRNIR